MRSGSREERMLRLLNTNPNKFSSRPINHIIIVPHKAALLSIRKKMHVCVCARHRGCVCVVLFSSHKLNDSMMRCGVI